MQIKQAPRQRSISRAEQKEKTQARVIKAARELFSEKGFFGTRASDIAKAAGVAHGTVFSEYGSKVGLITGILETILGERIEIIQKAVKKGRKKGLSRSELFLKAVRANWEYDSAHHRLIQAYFSYSWVWDQEDESEYHKRQVRTLKIYLDLLEHGDALHIVEGEPDVHDRMSILVAVFNDALRSVRHGKDEVQWARIEKAAKLLFPFKD